MSKSITKTTTETETETETEKNPQWYYTAYWRDLSEDYLNKVEQKCKNPKFSSCCMLGPNESLKTVLKKDEMTLQKRGITRQQIADVLESLHVAYTYSNDFVSDQDTQNFERSKFIQNQKYIVRETTYMGSQYSPFQHPNDKRYYGYQSGDRNIYVIRTSDQAQFNFGHLLIHMIRHNGFFEGQTNMSGSCYKGMNSGFRINPEEVIDFFGIQPKTDYSIQWKSCKIWKNLGTRNNGRNNDIDPEIIFMDKYALRKWEHFDSQGKIQRSIYILWNDYNISSIVGKIALEKDFDVHELIDLYVDNHMQKRRTFKWEKEFEMTEDEFQQHVETTKQQLHTNVDLYLDFKKNGEKKMKPILAKAFHQFRLCMVCHENIDESDIPEALKIIDGYELRYGLGYNFNKGYISIFEPNDTKTLDFIADF